jgi:hypothetical protein
VTSWHLRHLATFGLVHDSERSGDRGRDGRQRWWEAAARGFRFQLPDDEEGQAAYRLLSAQMQESYGDLPRLWLRDVEPELPAVWRAQSGMANTRLVVTSEELDELQRQVEELLGAYVRRPADEAPPGSRGVRYLRYMMPEAEAGDSG